VLGHVIACRPSDYGSGLTTKRSEFLFPFKIERFLRSISVPLAQYTVDLDIREQMLDTKIIIKKSAIVKRSLLRGLATVPSLLQDLLHGNFNHSSNSHVYDWHYFLSSCTALCPLASVSYGQAFSFETCHFWPV